MGGPSWSTSRGASRTSAGAEGAGQWRAAPVVVIGAGPVGLAAAVALLDRGLSALVIERGPGAATNVREWGHVRLFSTWSMCLFAPAVARLEESGWRSPAVADFPTGTELSARYLVPLCRLPELQSLLRVNLQVISIEQFFDSSSGRFKVKATAPDGTVETICAAAVIDASGTWHRPNGLRSRGAPAAGEAGHRRRIRYGIPDALGAERDRYAGRRVAVVGAAFGHECAGLARRCGIRDRPDLDRPWRHCAGSRHAGFLARARRARGPRVCPGRRRAGRAPHRLPDCGRGRRFSRGLAPGRGRAAGRAVRPDRGDDRPAS
ncbi:MAG: FAD-dependent oxidoreductase [Alphaproteobacteria bacterium]|nr:FAD-dependent oxidoreductase [Alphaproteobacteria bacterium]